MLEVQAVDEALRSGLELAQRLADLLPESADAAIVLTQLRKTEGTSEALRVAIEARDFGTARRSMHDINNHLTGVLSIASLMIGDAEDRPDALALARAIVARGQEAAEAVRQLSARVKTSQALDGLKPV
jgi:hypothetical protein